MGSSNRKLPTFMSNPPEAAAYKAVRLRMGTIKTFRKLHLNSEKTPLFFIDHPKLPANAPIGFPHIIDAKRFGPDTDKRNLHTADGIATLLFLWRPEVLDDFLDMTVPIFEFVRREHNSFMLDTIIARDHRTVACGMYNPATLEWVIRILFHIEVSGRWIPLNGDVIMQGAYELVPQLGIRFASDAVNCQKWLERPGVQLDIYRFVEGSQIDKLPGTIRKSRGMKDPSKRIRLAEFGIHEHKDDSTIKISRPSIDERSSFSTHGDVNSSGPGHGSRDVQVRERHDLMDKDRVSGRN